VTLNFPPNTGRLNGNLLARDSKGILISNCIRAVDLMLDLQTNPRTGKPKYIVVDLFPYKMKGNSNPYEVLGKLAAIIKDLTIKHLAYLNDFHSLKCITAMGGIATDFLRSTKNNKSLSDEFKRNVMVPDKGQATLHPEFIFGSPRCYLLTLQQAERSDKNIAEVTGKPSTFWVDLYEHRSQDPHWEEYIELQREGRVRGGRRIRTYVYVSMYIYP
jgi:hypothetical protein